MRLAVLAKCAAVLFETLTATLHSRSQRPSLSRKSQSNHREEVYVHRVVLIQCYLDVSVGRVWLWLCMSRNYSRKELIYLVNPCAAPACLVSKTDEWWSITGKRKIRLVLRWNHIPWHRREAFKRFSGVAVLSILDINSAYYQTPLIPPSCRVSTFCIPSGLQEFNQLPMDISVGCQGLRWVTAELLLISRGVFFNLMDDLVV